MAAAIPGTKNKLTEEELTSISNFIKRQESIGKVDTLASLVFDVVKTYISAGELALRSIIGGEGFRTLDFGTPKEIFGKDVEIVGFSDPLDAELSGEFKNYYEKANKVFEKIDKGSLASRFARKKAGLEQSATVILAIVSIGAGIFFLSPNLTGNAIASLTNQTSSIIGAVLILIGIISTFIYFKKS